MKLVLNKFQFSNIMNEYFDNNPHRSRFSPEGLDAIFQHLETKEDELGIEIDFTPCDISQEFTEYTLQDVIDEFYDLESFESSRNVIHIKNTNRYIVDTHP